MVYREEKRDLLTVPQGYMLAHCISADFALGAGIAKQIDSAFNMRQMLHAMWGKNSGMEDNWSVPCCLPCVNVFNLVTKEKCFHKPTLESLESALEEMKNFSISMGVKKIAMPMIGCGLDRLEWDDVSEMIRRIFEDTDIEILVCVL